MPRPLRSLLTKPRNRGSMPLFRSAADLAEVIAKTDHVRFFKKPQTIATLLSNVFLARRACSQELANAIMDAARVRLQQTSDQPTEAFLAELEQTIEATNEAISRQGRRRDQSGAGDPQVAFAPIDTSVERAIE